MRLAAFMATGAVVAMILAAAFYLYLHRRYTTGLSSPGSAILVVTAIGAAIGALVYLLVKYKPVEKPE